MATRGEKIVALEVAGTMVIITVREISNGNIPKPSRYVASLVVFMALGGIATLGEDSAHFAAAFGGVVVLSTLFNHPDTTQKMLTKTVGALSSNGAPTSGGTTTTPSNAPGPVITQTAPGTLPPGAAPVVPMGPLQPGQSLAPKT